MKQKLYKWTMFLPFNSFPNIFTSLPIPVHLTIIYVMFTVFRPCLYEDNEEATGVKQNKCLSLVDFNKSVTLTNTRW